MDAVALAPNVTPGFPMVIQKDSLQCSREDHRFALLIQLQICPPNVSLAMRRKGNKATVAATPFSTPAGAVALITRGHCVSHLDQPWRGFYHGIRFGVNSTQQKQPELKATSQHLNWR